MFWFDSTCKIDHEITEISASEIVMWWPYNNTSDDCVWQCSDISVWKLWCVFPRTGCFSREWIQKGRIHFFMFWYVLFQLHTHSHWSYFICKNLLKVTVSDTLTSSINNIFSMPQGINSTLFEHKNKVLSFFSIIICR